MFEEVKLAIALLGGAVCGIYDLKTSDMLDPVGYAMIALGIGLHAYESFVTGNWFVLEWCLAVTALFFLFSLCMYHRGCWGGGDGEMLVAYGALLPFGYGSPSLAFPLLLFLNVFVVGAVYSVIYSLYRICGEKKLRKKLAEEMEGFAHMFFLAAIFFALSLALLISRNIFWNLPLILALLILYKPAIAFSKFVESRVFLKRISTKFLKPGDVLGEDIATLNLSSRLVRGLSKEEVRKIRRVRKYVVVKDGVRFIPVFPLALLVSLTGFPLFNYL